MTRETKPLAPEDALVLENLKLKMLLEQNKAQLVTMQAKETITQLRMEYVQKVEQIERTGGGGPGWKFEVEQLEWVREERVANGYATTKEE